MPFLSEVFRRADGLRALAFTFSVTAGRPPLQKGGVPAAPSGTATLLRLSPSHRYCLRALLAVTHFRHSRLPWLDGRCVQGPPGFHGLTGGVYKARERIHRAMADARLLRIQLHGVGLQTPIRTESGFSGSAPCRQVASRCGRHCNTCVAPDVRAVLI